MLSSDAVAVTPSKIFNSAVVEVTPSRIFNSAVEEVTPSRIFNSVAVDVTATSSFILGEVNVLFVRVSVDIRDTNVELPPVGNVNTSDALAECGCACSV